MAFAEEIERTAAVATGKASADREESIVSRVRRCAPLVVGVLVVVVAGAAHPQGNIDAGKTPAQMFSDTCTACHRRPQELKRASAGFLRQHYMPGAQEAQAMASYLSGVGSDPRAARDRAKEKQDRLERQEKAKAQQQAQEKTKAQPTPKGRRAAEINRAPAEQSPETPQETNRAEVSAVPRLEPFEE